MVAVEKKAVSRQDNVEIDPNIVFQNLIRAEVTLIKEKRKNGGFEGKAAVKTQ